MISETLIPLYQFTKWLGMNGYDTNGIERERCAKCCCITQYDWQHPTHWSRECLAEALHKAEDIVSTIFSIYPNRYQIEDEQHPFKGFLNRDGKFISYRPKRPVGFNEYGLHTLQFVETIQIDWIALIVNDLYPEEISLTVTIVTAQQLFDHSIRLYVTSDDFPERCLDFNSHLGEIRPYKNLSLDVVDNGDGTFTYTYDITLESFLLNNPQNWDDPECCLNQPLEETYCYIDEIDVFIEVPDCCAYLITEDYGCTFNCTDTEHCSCVYLRKIDNEFWFVPKPFDCIENESICLTQAPDRIRFNYVSGFHPDKKRYADREVARAVFMIAVALADCIKHCECAICLNKKIEYYRESDQYKIRQAVDDNGEYDKVEEILKDYYDIDLAKGLMRNRGILTAFSILRKLRPNPMGVLYFR